MNSEKRKRGQDESLDENEAKKAAPSHEAYTVGWVCALPKEQTAAIAMLDQRHPNVPNMQPPTDTNAYTLGSIGGHNIVIACLPKGQIGVVSAATVATNMVSTFPAIKIGLLVGIGGGVPSNKVRLGDVVVSTPTGAHPGVVQWDLGKAKEGGNFERTGSLNNPPTFLLAALTKLETAHEMEGSKIEEYLEELGRKFPKLSSKYLRSDALRDIIFKADCAHVNMDDISSSDEDESNPCRHCDKTKAKEERLRDTHIHYGLVASGNQVIKDGILRDKLNKDLGGHVLCVEMEAAGLMTNFPCIVVRGICDYADSHKNNEWQEHAAAVAAACAKEILAQIEPGAIQAERSVRVVLDDIRHNVVSTASHVNGMHRHLLKEDDLKILDWLTPIDYGKQNSDLFSRRHPGTGQWFLNSKTFETWLASQGKTLFCPGIPGCGKTIIASIVVNFLRGSYQSQTIGLAYIYCNYQRHNEQDLRSILASILKQLSQTLSTLPQCIRSLYDKYAHSKEDPPIESLVDAIIIVSGSLSNVFIVVDALDECPTSDDCRSYLISHLSGIQVEADVNIMYTSRHVLEIETLFDSCLRQQISANSDDVGMVIDSRLQNLLKRVQGGSQLGLTIKSAVIGLVDGMFLLAQLYLDVLHDSTSVAEVRKALKQLQDRNSRSERDEEKHHILEQAYDQAMERIKMQKPNFRNLGMKTLAWVTFAERPLTKTELQHALAIAETDTEFDPENLRTIERILSACAGLVIIDEQSDAVHLAHFTTREYFVAKQNEHFRSAQSYITSTCVTYLRFEGLWEHLFDNYAENVAKLCEDLDLANHAGKSVKSRWEDLLGNHSETCAALVCQFAPYAVSKWGHHACKSLHVLPHFINPYNNGECVIYIWGSSEGYRYGSTWASLPEHVLGAFGLQIIDRPIRKAQGPELKNVRTPRSTRRDQINIGIHETIEFIEDGANLKVCKLNKNGKWESKRGSYRDNISWTAQLSKKGHGNKGDLRPEIQTITVTFATDSPVVVRFGDSKSNCENVSAFPLSTAKMRLQPQQSS